MKKKALEIILSIASVAVFIILIAAVTLIIPASPGYGYAAALLVFLVIMGTVGLKLAEIPDK
ncbi:MAG: hypothetical protein OIN85_10265 [Candidatus Methanoperedens sp.]|nr:hypothetical protein [Candidatus Methanoperedens sp.]